MNELTGMGADDLTAQDFPAGTQKNLDLARCFPLGQGAVVFRKCLFPDMIVEPFFPGPFFIETDTGHLRVRISAPADPAVVRFPREMENRIGQGNARFISGHVRKGELAIHVSAGVDVMDIGFQARICRDAVGRERHTGGLEI